MWGGLGASLEVAFQNGLRLTVDFFRESWPYTVDYGFKSWPTSTVDSRGFKKEIATVATSRQSIFVDSDVDFSSNFSGKMEEFVQNGLKIFKNFRRSQQSTMWPIRDPATVYFFRESWPTVDLKKKIQRLSTVGQLSKKNPATVDISSKVDCRLQGFF
jgi:hypothetical protein